MEEFLKNGNCVDIISLGGILTPEMISSLSRNLAEVFVDSSMQNSDNIKHNNLKILRFLVSSPFPNTSPLVSDQDILAALLSSNCESVVKKAASSNLCFDFGRAIMNVNLPTNIKSNVLSILIKQFISNLDIQRTEFLNHIWDKQETNSLSCKNLLLIAQALPQCLERSMVLLSQEAVELPFNDYNLHSLRHGSNIIEMSAQSSDIFLNVLSILFSLTKLSYAHNNMLSLIETFVIEVRKHSENFVELFPLDLQELLLFLQIEPKFFPKEGTLTENVIVKKLHELQNKNCALLLLLCYPNWLTSFVENSSGTYKELCLLKGQDLSKKAVWLHLFNM